MNTPLNSDPALVLAWEVVRYDEALENIVCAFYAQTVYGETFTTGFRLNTKEVRDNFEVKGDTWTPIEKLPQAEFIGHYPRPRGLR
jgi:hypothetical protein